MSDVSHVCLWNLSNDRCNILVIKSYKSRYLMASEFKKPRNDGLK